MPKRISVLLCIPFMMLPVACLLDNTVSLVAPVQAGAVDTETKSCVKDTDCTLINQDCCGEESGITVISRESARRLQNKISADCKNKHKAASLEKRSLCDVKKPRSRSKYPKVACESGVCAIKVKPAEFDKFECSYDGQCAIFDPDCCNSGESVIAINLKSGASERYKKSAECKAKLPTDKQKLQEYLRTCNRDRPLKMQTKTAVCVDKKCTVK